MTLPIAVVSLAFHVKFSTVVVCVVSSYDSLDLTNGIYGLKISI